MRTENVQLHSLSYSNVKTYLIASLFVLGNITFPQLFHLMPQGGVTWLPIYFFTLIGAYKFGWRVGLLIAILSPTFNSLMFGMPLPAALPAILLKSILLVISASWAAHRFQYISLPVLLAVVLSYQLLGTLGEWAMAGSFFAATQDFRIGIPGMGLQIVGGYLLLKLWGK